MSAALNGWWQATGLLALEILLLVMAAAMLQRLHRSPHWTRAVWNCALICLIALAACEWFGVAPQVAALVPPLHSRVEPAVKPTGAPRSGPLPLAAKDLPQVVSVEPETLAVAAPSSPPPLDHIKRPSVFLNWPTARIAATVWIAGAALILGYLLFARGWLTLSLARLPRDRQLNDEVQQLLSLLRSRSRVRVISSPKFLSPIAFGFIRPVIVVPANFKSSYTRPQQRAILLHELAHVVAHDPFWHFLADVLGAVLWWHPAVWWARRRFLAACEMAADDIVRLLPEGAATLAASLVELGARYRAPWPQAAAQGAAFRSGLGRRVERLLISPSPTRPRLLLVRLILWIGPIGLVAGTVLGSAWVRPHPPQPSETNMKKTTLAATGLLMAMNLAQAQQPTPAPGVLANPQASYSKQDPASGGANPQAIPNIPAGSKPRIGAPQIQRKLERMIMERVESDSLPLGEIVKGLIVESTHLDPDEQGINFVFQVFRPSAAVAIDPATGLPLPENTAESIDLTSVTVRITPPLRNVRMIDVLDAITRVADRPISYAITDYAVVISLRKPQLDSGSLAVETFSIQPLEFFQGIEQAFGVEVRSDPISQTDLKRVLNRLGVDTEDFGKAAFYNAQTGVLMVRLTPDEVAIVEAAVRTLGGKPLRDMPPEKRGFGGGGFGAGGVAPNGTAAGVRQTSPDESKPSGGNPGKSF